MQQWLGKNSTIGQKPGADPDSEGRRLPMKNMQPVYSGVSQNVGRQKIAEEVERKANTVVVDCVQGFSVPGPKTCLWVARWY